MLLDISHTIIDFVALVTRLATEELTDEQRMVLFDQFMRFQGLGAVFEFDLHDLLMILIMASDDMRRGMRLSLMTFVTYLLL